MLQTLIILDHSHGIASSASLAAEHARTPKACRYRRVLPGLDHNCYGNPSPGRDGEGPPRGHVALHISRDRSRRDRRVSAGLLVPGVGHGRQQGKEESTPKSVVSALEEFQDSLEAGVWCRGNNPSKFD